MAPTVIKTEYNEKDIRLWIPEACHPLVKIWALELKNTKSYWQVGTSTVTRIKPSALMPGAHIYTSRARMIEGTASENYEDIETLGIVEIKVCDTFYMNAYVTRSNDVAPFMVDGIIGWDFIKGKQWVLDRGAHIFHRPNTVPRLQLSLLPPDRDFPNYAKSLREVIPVLDLTKKINAGVPATTKYRLRDARAYLSPKVNGDSRPPVISVITDYCDCLFLASDIIAATKLLEYPIKTQPCSIVAINQPELSSKDWNEIERIVKDLLRQDIIQKSTSPYNSRVGLLAKKPDARGNIRFRLAVDYSQLNDRTESETFPIPEIYDAADQLHGSKYFSVLDLASASYHIPIESQDCCKTAFTTKSGHYEFRRVPANMKNGGPCMQRLMNKVLQGIGKGVFVCHDDILIHAPTIEEHEVRIRKVLDRIRTHGLKLQPRKCQLFESQVLYLGFLITDEGIRPDPAKIEKLRLPRIPDNREALRSWLGLLSTHKRFLAGYAGRAQPMFDMLKQTSFAWTVRAQRNYEYFQLMLSGKLLLRYPDWNSRFIIETGFDDYGIYAGLLQNVSYGTRGVPEAIAWDSRTYSSIESRLDARARENLASEWGSKTFHRYVRNTKPLDELARSLSIRN